ncbi:MAG TPA: pyridoxal phosphate-dependent aminotransferase [Candidatus Limnocylindrales bacterium]|nr:pyridoxal phosphate-dependent aminotransferase [Candidatus Limnocylindrales bacterium]
MMRLSQRASAIKPSSTLEITTLAKKMRAEGIDVIGFGAGEPDFDTPSNVKEAAIRAIQEGFTKYTPVPGIDELRAAIAKKLEKDNNLIYRPSEVIVSCGAKHVLFNAIMALFEEGDEVIVASPYWETFLEQIQLMGATPVIVYTDESTDFQVTRELLETAITKKTKGLILNTPCNPTGAVIDREHLKAIAALAVEKNIYVISDETYEKLVYEDAEHVSIASLNPEIKELTLTVGALSKSYSMTGWRIGYAAGPAEVIKAMVNLQSQSTSNPTSIAQKAALEALTGPQEALSEMRLEFLRRRNYIVQELNTIPGISCLKPKGAFYVFPKVSSLYGRTYQGRTISNSKDLASYLLAEARVAVVPGSAFGSDQHVRLSYALSMEHIREGLHRIKEAIGKLL